MIAVKIEENWGECGHQEGGCSGWTSIKYTASDENISVSVENSSCYGVNQEELMAQLLEKFTQEAIREYVRQTT